MTTLILTKSESENLNTIIALWEQSGQEAAEDALNQIHWRSRDRIINALITPGPHRPDWYSGQIISVNID